jgi:hypothetical protein
MRVTIKEIGISCHVFSSCESESMKFTTLIIVSVKRYLYAASPTGRKPGRIARLPHVPSMHVDAQWETGWPKMQFPKTGQKTHLPEQQEVKSRHLLPHTPQSRSSLLVSTHVPPQRVLPLGQEQVAYGLSVVWQTWYINAHLDASIGGAGERLDHRPVSQTIGRNVDFALCGVDQRHVHMLKIFGRCIMDDGRGIVATWRGKGEKCRDG